MNDAVQANLVIDHRLETYGTIFNHKWFQRILEKVEGTKLDPPFSELAINWRAAVNTHAFPWMMMQSLGGLWEGHLKDAGVTTKFIRALASEIPRRMATKMTVTDRQRLGAVLQEYADQVQDGVDSAPELKLDADAMWKHFLEKEMVEFHVAIWGSQRFCFGGLYHAFESYFRQVLAIKKGNPDYRFRNFPQLVEHTTAEFGRDIANKCLSGEFLDVTRWVRNSLRTTVGRKIKS